MTPTISAYNSAYSMRFSSTSPPREDGRRRRKNAPTPEQRRTRQEQSRSARAHNKAATEMAFQREEALRRLSGWMI
jgi:hypothetical protein